MAKLVINKEIANSTSGAKLLAKMRLVSNIKTNPDLASRFTIDEKVLNSIIKSIKSSGFDKSEPIVIWKEEDVVVDGHTRLKAAQIAELEEVPVIEKSFLNFEEAKNYTEHRQFARRNLSQAEIYNYANNTKNMGEERTVETLAKEIGVSKSTLEKARTVNKKASKKTKEKVQNNEMTINQAYTEIRQKKENKNITLFEKIKKMNIESLSLYLANVQQQIIKTQTQWLDDLNKMELEQENDLENGDDNI